MENVLWFILFCMWLFTVHTIVNFFQELIFLKFNRQLDLYCSRWIGPLRWLRWFIVCVDCVCRTKFVISVSVSTCPMFEMCSASELVVTRRPQQNSKLVQTNQFWKQILNRNYIFSIFLISLFVPLTFWFSFSLILVYIKFSILNK